MVFLLIAQNTIDAALRLHFDSGDNVLIMTDVGTFYLSEDGGINFEVFYAFLT